MGSIVLKGNGIVYYLLSDWAVQCRLMIISVAQYDLVVLTYFYFFYSF